MAQLACISFIFSAPKIRGGPLAPSPDPPLHCFRYTTFVLVGTYAKFNVDLPNRCQNKWYHYRQYHFIMTS